MTRRRRRSPSKSGRLPAYLLAGGMGVILLGIVLLVGQLPQLTTLAPDAESPAAATGEPTPTGDPVPAETPATPPAQTPAQPAAEGDVDARKITATLYYVATTGTELVGVTRDVPYGATPSAQARHIVEAQLGPPPSGLLSAIPPGTTVHTVYITTRGEAYVDLSRQLLTGHAGGSMNEALAVYALVNAMAVNLPDVSAVQLLVDGQEVDSIDGHLDLRHPLRRASEWVRKGQ